MFLNDSLIYNTLAQHILNKYINGTVLCIKLSKSSILDINVTDIPFLVDNLLSGYFNSINLIDTSSNILSNNVEINNDTDLIVSTNTLKYIDTNMKEPYDDIKESSDTDDTNSVYYDYHTGYNS